MGKLDDLLIQYAHSANLLTEQMPPADPMAAPPMDPAMGAAPPMGGMPMMPPMAPMAPPPERKELTSPGREFLIELVRKALGVDPNDLSEHDKAVFEKNVNMDPQAGNVYTADDLLDELNDIVDSHSVVQQS
jgi:hypothetical protein